MVCNKRYNAFHPPERRLDCAGPMKPCSNDEPYCSHSFEKGLNFTGIVKTYVLINKSLTRYMYVCIRTFSSTTPKL